MMDRDELNGLECRAPEVADESEHFIVCVTCGQAIDCRKLGDVFHHDVFHHEDPGHERLLVQ